MNMKTLMTSTLVAGFLSIGANAVVDKEIMKAIDDCDAQGLKVALTKFQESKPSGEDTYHTAIWLHRYSVKNNLEIHLSHPSNPKEGREKCLGAGNAKNLDDLLAEINTIYKNQDFWNSPAVVEFMEKHQ